MMERKLMIIGVMFVLLFVLYLGVILFKYISRTMKTGDLKRNTADSWSYIEERITADESAGMREIVAAITAAICSCGFSRPGYRLEVRSVRRVSDTAPIWNHVSKIERINGTLNRHF